MPTCPRCRLTLRPVRKGISLVCPTCDHKEYIKAKYNLPEVRHTIEFPTAFAWSTWTLTDLTTNAGGDLVISSGKTIGTAVSPQIINLTRDTRRYYDCTKIKLIWTHSKQTGKGIKYYTSNDGGSGYRIIHKPDTTFNLLSGKEQRQYKQVKYNDLRVKIVLERTLTSDTSPSVTRLVIKYNKVTL